MSAGLWLDHASLCVPSLPLAIRRLDEVLGLTVVPTPARPAAHARIWLDRSYLEVRAEGAWGLGGFFLGFPERVTTQEALAARGLVARPAPRYVGVDGAWEELHLEGPGDVPLPILVRRIEPPELARDWPPPLSTAHPGGAISLAGLELVVPELTLAAPIYRALGASSEGDPGNERLQVQLGARGKLVARRADGARPGLRTLLLEVDALEPLVSRAARAGAQVSRTEEEGRPVARLVLPEAPGITWAAIERRR